MTDVWTLSRWKRASMSAAAVAVVSGTVAPASDYVRLANPVDAFETVFLSAPQEQGRAYTSQMQPLSNSDMQALLAIWGTTVKSARVSAGFAFWGGDTALVLLKDHLDETCNIAGVFSGNEVILADYWNALVQKHEQGFRTASAVTLNADRRGQWGGFASKPVDDGYLQISMTSLDLGDAYALIFVSAMVPQTPVSCELWPEECT